MHWTVRGGLGLASGAERQIAGCSLLGHTLRRAARIEGIAAIVLICPDGVDLRGAVDGLELALPLKVHPVKREKVIDRFAQCRWTARRWSAASWRGGPGGACIFDELLPAQPLLEGLDAAGAGSAIVLGADWPLLDPALCSRILAQHRENPEAFAMTFSQAPPGLAGVAVGRTVLADLAAHPGTSFGAMLSYRPQRPQADPVGKDVCIGINPQVRQAAWRFVGDCPRGIRLLEAIAAREGGVPEGLAAEAVAAAAVEVAGDGALDELPNHITLELTPQRRASGPATPQYHCTIERPPISVQLARSLIEQVAACGDVTLTLGGLGDALLHPQWAAIVDEARRAGVFSIALETDLLEDDDQLAARLLDSGADVIVPRVNADTAATYREVMGVDAFDRVTRHMENLINIRNRRAAHQPEVPADVPWIIPKMVRCARTLGEIELFFDRWLTYAGHAVIEPEPRPDEHLSASQDAPALRGGLVHITPPPGVLRHRWLSTMTIHSDGTVPSFNEDWLGRDAAGSAAAQPLASLWHTAHQARMRRLAELEAGPAAAGLLSGDMEWSPGRPSPAMVTDR